MPPDADSSKSDRIFHTTRWSVVLAAGNQESPDAHSALTQLCQAYWYPLYCCVRRHGHQPAVAEDLTQAFFGNLLEKNHVALADPERGRFRTFLLRSLENFLRKQYRDATTQKRGGGKEIISWDAQTAEERYAAEPPDGTSPAELFEREWAGTMLENVIMAVRHEFSASGKLELFSALEPSLWGDDTSTPYGQIGQALNMTPGAVRVTVHRLRRRFQELLCAEIANTVEKSADVEPELQYLRRVLVG
jgi:RNA polymerase sigma factor (sigma-70 family)